MIDIDEGVKHSRYNEHTFRSLLEHSDDGIVILSIEGKPLYISPSVTRILGYSEEEIMTMDMFMLTQPEDILPLLNIMKQVMASPGIPIKGHTGRMKHKDGSWRWIEATVTNFLHDPSIAGIVDNFRDITNTKAAEEKILHANRLYAFISQINQTIVHSTNEQELFKKACSIAIEFGKFKAAWIGIFDIPVKKIKLVEESGMPAEDLQYFTNVDYSENGPQGHILQTGKQYICNNIEEHTELGIWKPFALKRGYASYIALPIRKAGNIIGTFNIVSTEIEYFDEQEIALLTEATGDISFALDVFEKEKHRKQMADKVIRSELQLKQAQAIAHIGSWDLPFSTGIATWSDEACKIYGLDPTDSSHSYDEWEAFIHPEDLIHVTEATKRSQDTLSSSAFHHRIILKDGSVKHIYSRSEYEFDKDGKAIGIHGVAHDLTEMKEAEKGLARSESNLYALLENTDAAIYSLDRNLCYTTFNKSMSSSLKQTYGLKIKLGDNVYNFLEKIEPGEAIAWKGIYARALAGETVKFEKEFNIGDSFSCLSFAIYPIWEEKIVIGLSCFATDITTQKQDAIQKEKMLADIIHRNKNLEQFSYIVSHNLRAPVANILGLTDLLVASNYNDEDRTVIEGISTSVQKLDMVINDLNYVLQVNHQVSENKEIVKFAVVLSDIKSSINNLLNTHEVEIIADFSAVDEIFTLKSYLHSIFFNLISNSVKYAQPGITPVINITSLNGEKSTQLIFCDNGLGIDLNINANHIFGLYKRFHNHTEGKGMGLYMVRKQVEALGGKITIASEVNKGTTFTITFETLQK